MLALLTITNPLRIYTVKIRDVILFLRAPLWKGSRELSHYYLDQHINKHITKKYYLRFFAKLLSRVSLEVGSDLILKEKSPLLWKRLSSYKKIETTNEQNKRYNALLSQKDQHKKKILQSYEKEIIKKSLIGHALDLQADTIETWCKKKFPHVHNIKFLGFGVGKLLTTGSVYVATYVVLHYLLKDIL